MSDIVYLITESLKCDSHPDILAVTLTLTNKQTDRQTKVLLISHMTA